jgi:uncharacterized protein YbjT (DUF2867 family)
MASVFITGASGFMGRRLSAELVARGHSVRGLVRRGSEKHVAIGCEGVTGDPLDASTYQTFVAGCDTLVHLVGVAHPSPAKKQQFRTIDLASAMQAIAAAASGGVRHMVYVSVAHPAPVMRDYIAARTEAEDAIRKARVNATILRPWYLLEALPGTRESARRLGLVSVEQMIASMARAIADPPNGVRVWEVPEIRFMGT